MLAAVLVEGYQVNGVGCAQHSRESRQDEIADRKNGSALGKRRNSTGDGMSHTFSVQHSRRFSRVIQGKGGCWLSTREEAGRKVRQKIDRFLLGIAVGDFTTTFPCLVGMKAHGE